MEKLKLYTLIVLKLLKPENFLDLLFRLFGIYVIYTGLTGGFLEIRIEKGFLVALGIVFLICKWTVNCKWLKFSK